MLFLSILSSGSSSHGPMTTQNYINKLTSRDIVSPSQLLIRFGKIVEHNCLSVCMLTQSVQACSVDKLVINKMNNGS